MSELTPQTTHYIVHSTVVDPGPNSTYGTSMEKAGFVLNLADGLGPNETQGLLLGDDGELQVWRERGREASGRAYLVRVGDIAPAFRATSQGLLVAYVMAMNPAYVASKHGVLGLARAIAVEMAPHNVRANCIIPGFIVTEALERIPEEQKGKIAARVPMRRMGTPMELAEVAAFLLSDAASHVTGQDWAVDGGVLESIEV